MVKTLPSSCRILGIDPALRNAGWGVIDVLPRGKLGFVACGVLKTDTKDAMPTRLAHLHDYIAEIISQHQPTHCAIEETFVNTNPRSALILGQARGVLMTAPALYGLPVAEYAANAVKKAVTGSGHADKQQIQAMVKMLLPKAGHQPHDAADALAIAICHAHMVGTQLNIAS